MKLPTKILTALSAFLASCGGAYQAEDSAVGADEVELVQESEQSQQRDPHQQTSQTSEELTELEILIDLNFGNLDLETKKDIYCFQEYLLEILDKYDVCVLRHSYGKDQKHNPAFEIEIFTHEHNYKPFFAELGKKHKTDSRVHFEKLDNRQGMHGVIRVFSSIYSDNQHPEFSYLSCRDEYHETEPHVPVSFDSIKQRIKRSYLLFKSVDRAIKRLAMQDKTKGEKLSWDNIDSTKFARVGYPMSFNHPVCERYIK